MTYTTEHYCVRVTDGTHDTPKPQEEGYPLVTSKNILNGELNLKDTYLISEEDYNKINKRSKVDQWDILFSMIGSVGEVYLHRNENCEFAIKNIGLFKMGGDKEKALKLYYFLKSPYFQRLISVRLSGSIQSFLPLSFLRKIELPNINGISNDLIQEIEIVQMKIDNNALLIQYLEEYSQLLFHKWFIDFNFPDENGNPYKNSGGELQEVNGKFIPVDWKFSTIGDISVNFDSKRIPLSDSVRQNKQGKFPYYGATEIMDYIDDYIFDGLYCLIAEDGTVIDENNKPIMQLAWDKFWVNNHAHVLQGKGEISTEFLYLTLKRTNVLSMVTGAIQKKINQANLNKIKIIHPESKVLRKFDNIISIIIKRYILVSKEMELLKETRNLLNKKLFK